jgi:hypothetical protein
MYFDFATQTFSATCPGNGVDQLQLIGVTAKTTDGRSGAVAVQIVKRR